MRCVIDYCVLALVVLLVKVGLSQKFKEKVHLILVNVARGILLVKVENFATLYLPLVFIDARGPRPFSLAQYVLNLS